MEVTEGFRIKNKAECAKYLESRGFNLFEKLKSQLKREPRVGESERQMDENWKINESWVCHLDQDYRQYETHSTIGTPTSEQCSLIDREFDLLCFQSLKHRGPNITELRYGEKIGCKLSAQGMQWVEKWATIDFANGSS